MSLPDSILVKGNLGEVHCHKARDGYLLWDWSLRRNTRPTYYTPGPPLKETIQMGFTIDRQREEVSFHGVPLLLEHGGHGLYSVLCVLLALADTEIIVEWDPPQG